MLSLQGSDVPPDPKQFACFKIIQLRSTGIDLELPSALYLIDNSLYFAFKRFLTIPAISPGSAWRWVSSLEYSSFPSIENSKRPPSDGTSVIDSISGSNSLSNSAARPTARSV
jgi:hypothetical protein